MSEMVYNFNITTPLEVEETIGETKILTGTFLRLNKATKNGREYLIEEGEQIAEGLINMPIRHGADWMGKHIKNPINEVGRVIEAWVDEVTNTIKGKIQVWNTAKFPDIIAKIRNGWGFSIGGTAQNLLPTGALNRLGRAIMRVIGMKPNHLQLLKPETKRGQDEAQVEDLEESFYEIEETLSFDPCPWGVCELPTESPEEVKEMVEETELVNKEDFKTLLDRLESLESKVIKSIEVKDTRVKKNLMSIERAEDDSFVVKVGDAQIITLDKDTSLHWDGENLDTSEGGITFGEGKMYTYEEPAPLVFKDDKEEFFSDGLTPRTGDIPEDFYPDNDIKTREYLWTVGFNPEVSEDTTKTQEEIDAETAQIGTVENTTINNVITSEETDLKGTVDNKKSTTYIVPGKGVKKIRHA